MTVMSTTYHPNTPTTSDTHGPQETRSAGLEGPTILLSVISRFWSVLDVDGSVDSVQRCPVILDLFYGDWSVYGVFSTSTFFSLLKSRWPRLVVSTSSVNRESTRLWSISTQEHISVLGGQC